ncbi:hypothetical protein D3C75_908100 [compost metagenome]
MLLAAAPDDWAAISFISAAMVSRPSLPASESFCSSAVFLPVTCSSSCQTGTPRSISCRISSPCSFCLAQAWPRAREMPCTSSNPPPSLNA